MRKSLLLLVFSILSFGSIAQQQIINVGSSANDHTGDALRTAFQKTNANFTELYNAVFPYVNPNFTAFTFTGFTPDAEVGITLSGLKAYTWGINPHSGVVSTIDVRDVTASSTLLAGTPNDGAQSITINTIQLNTPTATQTWRGIGNNSSPTGTFNSSDLTVTAWWKYFAGDVATSVTNSTTVRALGTSGFQKGGSFTFSTGTTNKIFDIALGPGSTLVMVKDNTLNIDITSSFIAQSNINVLDAGSTNRSYLIWEYTASSPYATAHSFTVTYL